MANEKNLEVTFSSMRELLLWGGDSPATFRRGEHAGLTEIGLSTGEVGHVSVEPADIFIDCDSGVILRCGDTGAKETFSWPVKLSTLLQWVAAEKRKAVQSLESL